MILFVAIAAVMLLVALAFLLPPLLRTSQPGTVGRDEVNVAIYRQRLAELEAELANGIADSAEVEERREELERGLLADLDRQAAPRRSGGRRKWTAAWIAVGLPVLAVTLYIKLGVAPIVALMDRPVDPALAARHHKLELAVERLAAEVKRRPRDAEVWSMLAHGYLLLERYPDAVRAYTKAHALAGDRPDVLVGYAQALASTAGGDFAGRPAGLLARALGIDPDHQKGLWLAGIAAFQRGDYRRALVHWRRLQRLGAGDADLQRVLRKGIAEAEARLKKRG